MESSSSKEVNSAPRMTYSQIMEEKIASMLEQSRQLVEDGKPSAALAKLTRAISIQPTNAELFNQRAEVNLILYNFRAAIINFEKVLALEPSRRQAVVDRLAAAHFEYGQHLFQEESFSKALEMFTLASQYRPDDKRPIMQRIASLLALEMFDECLVAIQQELEADGSNAQLYVLRAKLNSLFGHTTRVYYDVCSALTLDPTHEEASRMKAELEEKASVCKNQAVHLSLSGKRSEALKKITTAIDTDPAVADYHIFRGALYRRLSDYNAAMDDFLQAMDKCAHQQESSVYKNASRQLVLTYNDFAMDCFKRRYFSEAVTLLNKAIKDEKNEKGLYLNRGDCFYRLGKLHFALSDYQQALELEPSDWDVRCRVAVVHCEIGVEHFSSNSHSEAEHSFTTAIECNPKVCRFYICRARARHELQNTEGTQEDILTALVLDPANEECIPLTAVVFPAKSRETLLLSNHAATARAKLAANIARITDLGKCSEKVKPLSATSRVLKGIEIKVEGNSTTEQTLSKGGGLLSLCDRKDRLTSPGFEDPRHRHTEPKADTTSGTVHQESSSLPLKNTQESSHSEHVRFKPSSSERLVPRRWPVLEDPMPRLPPDPESLLPAVRESKQESQFHKHIYYSKKNCTEEVQRVLKGPTEFPKLHRT